MGQLKYHNGTAWTPLIDKLEDYSVAVKGEPLAGTIDGVNRAFTVSRDIQLNVGPGTHSIAVYKNGVRMKQGEDYVYSAARTITFTTAPPVGSVLLADYDTVTSYAVNGSATNAIKQDAVGVKDGVNKLFQTPSSYIGSTLQVYINGLYEGNLVEETNPLGKTFTLATAPLATDNIQVSYQTVISAGGNADTVDGYHAGGNAANTLAIVGSNGKLPTSLTGESFSITEASTGGEWIDGKTIYKKTVNIGTLPNSANKNTAHGITGLSTMIRWETVGVGTGGQAGTYIDLMSGNGCNTYVQGSNIIIATSISRSDFNGYVTVYYTKV
jgi:hypothetical protein